MKVICRVNKTDRAFPTHPVSEQAYYFSDLQLNYTWLSWNVADAFVKKS